MAFWKRNELDTPIAPVDWRDVETFVLGTLERALAPKRPREVRGPMAIRVEQDHPRGTVYAPCAFRGSLTGPTASGTSGKRWFEDLECLRVLCHVDDGVEDGGLRRYEVRDGSGEVIGTIECHPPQGGRKRPSWRIQQPGHPEIVGRSDGDLIERGLVGAFEFANVLYESAMLGDQRVAKPKKPRAVNWKDETGRSVMLSQGKKHTVRVAWLDRRLAFAFALLGDGDQAVGAEPT
ncbi:hypothetical protein [Streptomyces sp. NPDC088923]|uniref:hypothetical protein n=1 Tax=Streptomyces sp. NPDC088923 TaxID=3365913 RepID=UPI003802F879